MGIGIAFIRKRNVRQEDLVKQALTKRGEHPGLVCILSALEPCSTYQPWHDKATGKTFLRPGDGKRLHYYFYFIDEELGLCYVSVSTWLPRRLQIYFNGHNWLAAKLRRQNIAYQLMDNAFVEIADWNRSQQLANGLDIKRLHGKLDQWPAPAVRSTGTSACSITGASINASTPPRWCSSGRPIWRRSTIP